MLLFVSTKGFNVSQSSLYLTFNYIHTKHLHMQANHGLYNYLRPNDVLRASFVHKYHFFFNFFTPTIMATRTAAIFDSSKACSPLSIPAANTALLLLDYQNITVSMASDGGQTVTVAREMRDWAVEQGIPAYHCLVDTTSAPEPSMKISERWVFYEEKLKVAPELGNEPDVLKGLDKIFTRQPGYISALKSPGLLEELQTKGVRSLILCGLSTSGCVLSTARAANDHGFVVTIVDDACWDPLPELHALLMGHVLASTAHIAKAKEVQQAWKRS